MTRSTVFVTVLAAALSTPHPGSAHAAAPAPQLLVQMAPAVVDSVQAKGAKCKVVTEGAVRWLRIEMTGEEAEAVLTPKAEWDLSSRASVRTTVRNSGKEPVTVRLRAENPDAKGLTDSCRAAIEVLPGEKREFSLPLTRRPEDPTYQVFAPYYMYFKNINVRDNTIDPARVARLVVAIDGAKPGQAIDVGDIHSAGEATNTPTPFFPFVDGYGQYVHGSWTGKIHADSDFADRVKEEARERAEWPRPKEWNDYGGWATGPKLKATGFFYPAKHDGKWWLVDPDGRLFWSYGPTGVGFGGDVSPVSERENWFRELPARDSEFGRFYRTGRGATYMFYKERDWLGFDVQGANLLRKYGKNYEEDVAKISHERLHSWGFNTMGNWSASKIYEMRRTPYTVAVHGPNSSAMKWTDGHSFQDVYDPKWEPGLRAELEKQRGTTAGDPWCIGYFVDNERSIGWRPRAAAIGEMALGAPANQPAKVKFVEQLKSKYPAVAALNKAWGTTYASWDELLESRKVPPLKDNEGLTNDCGDFGMAFCERYFSVCRDAVKRVAPNNMFLGSRFYGHTDSAVVALAAKYWDLISYNIYDNPPDGRVNQLKALDVPVMSTEWGVGSDPLQTPFRGRDMAVPTPAERAQEMARYADRAIRHPNMVGAHFFQYRDQPLSGRPDGEATLRGFVNIADTPNFELVQANREVAYKMYETRSKAK